MSGDQVQQGVNTRGGLGSLAPAPVFVLVEPQMGENIGAAARAMLNFGVSGLRIVRPRDGWPNPKAGAMASGASTVIDNARIFESVGAAISDCHYVLAATARPREILTPVLDPRSAASELKERVDQGQTCAVLFGGERSGLANEDVARADGILTIPVNPAFASLNLGQAALIVAYEWALACERKRFTGQLDLQHPVSRGDFENFFSHLREELEASGYFYPLVKKTMMERNLRVLFTRAGLTESETRALRGVIKSLATSRRKKADKNDD